ncbi:MAG: hypothetical protein ABSF83_00465 [Nitrososphaerales archaeon]
MSARVADLIEAVDRIGIKNVAALSRMTGMPKETIRYTLRKRFPELDLRVETVFNLGELGLQRYSATMEFAPDALRQATSILDKLSNAAFLTYRSSMLLEPAHAALFSVPVVVEDRFQAFMKGLIDEGILRRVELKRLEWTRNPDLKARYYDFDRGQWTVDWNEVRELREAPPSPVVVEEPLLKPSIDLSDVLLIKELEAGSLRSLKSISTKLEVNAVTLRWHYRKHVMPITSYHRVRWIPARGGDQSKVVGVIFWFSQLTRTQLAQARLLFNNVPFTWFEAGSRDGSYRADLAIPTQEFVVALEFLRERLGEMSLPEWKTQLLDLPSSMRYTIPYEHFTDEEGWTFEPEKALSTILSVVKQRG